MEKKNNTSVALTILGVATLLVALVGATFAYFTATKTSDPQSIDTGKLEILTTLNATGQSNIMPTTWDDTTIANNGTNDNIAKFVFTVDCGDTNVRGAVYDISMTGAAELTTVDNGVTDQKGSESEIEYRLVKDVDGSGTVTAGDMVVGKPENSDSYTYININNPILTAQPITPKTTTNDSNQIDKYILCVFIKETNDNQDRLQGATVKATMTASAYTPK